MSFNPFRKITDFFSGPYQLDLPMRKADGENIEYYDTDVLLQDRPFTRQKQIVAGIIVALGIALAAFIVYSVVSSTMSGGSVGQNATAEVSYDFPQATQYALLGRDDILAQMDAAGYTYIDVMNEEDGEGGLDAVRLPDGVSAADAAIWYAQGLTSINAADAAKFLNGSWRITLNTTEGYDLRVRYGEFKSASQQDAVNNAISAIGLGESTVAGEGVDDQGNTYKEGTAVVSNGQTVHWRVAACPLSEVYAINGLPSNASYVAIRIYQ